MSTFALLADSINEVSALSANSTSGPWVHMDVNFYYIGGGGGGHSVPKGGGGGGGGIAPHGDAYDIYIILLIYNIYGTVHAKMTHRYIYIIVYGMLSSKITLLDRFSSFQIFLFSVNSKELLSNGPYAS